MNPDLTNLTKQEQEVVELSSDDDSPQPVSEEESEEEGDPNREPGADATKTIDPAHLVPFR